MLTRIAAAVLTLGLAVTLTSPASAEVGSRQRAVTLQLVGNGYGHGHGCRSTARRVAPPPERPATQILSFYYPGLSTGRAGGNVSVLITADSHPRRDRRRASGPDGRAGDGAEEDQAQLGQADRYALADRARSPVGAGSTSSARAGGRLTTLPGRRSSRPRGSRSRCSPPAKLQVAYRGKLRAIGGDTVNILALEDYLQGRRAARGARALASAGRAGAGGRGADLRGVRAAQPDRAALPDLRHHCVPGLRRLHRRGGCVQRRDRGHREADPDNAGEPAFTQFSASNGGWTSAGAFPYLPAKPDPLDTSYRGWTDSVTAAEIEKAYPALGDIRRVPRSRSATATASGVDGWSG